MPLSRPEAPTPQATLSIADVVAIMVGIVIGIGIFKTPPLVAMNVGSEAAFIGAWLVGGLIMLIGALCYSELAAAHPSAGGEYHFLARAYGRRLAVLFGWARISVIQTGAIAAVAFVFGDYAKEIVPLGPYGSSIYAAAAIVALTALNVWGTPQSKNAQRVLTGLTVLLILGVVAAGFLSPAATGFAGPAGGTAAGSMGGAFGMAMVFVLLTYGGWNEAAYLSAETRDVRRSMVRALAIGSAVIVAVYLLVNLAYLNMFGLEGLRKSDAVAADLMRATLGAAGAVVISIAVSVAALSTLNGTIFTGARLYYALGRDLPLLQGLGIWSLQGQKPRNALIAQSSIALALVLLGALTRDGFQAMVDYTAPVFWFFMLLIGASVIVLRMKEPGRELPFRVPLYPVTPILFCLVCAGLVYSSLVYTGLGALFGIAVLLVGTPLLLMRAPPETAPAE